MTADSTHKPSDRKPSRSEIESALGVGHRSSSRHRSQNHATQQESRNASGNRQQKVIGGDLTGISRRNNKHGVLAKLRDIDYTIWIAGTLVVAILAVFFWPQGDTNKVREITAKKDSAATGYRGVERADKPVTVEKSGAPFSRIDDHQRATQFRLEDTQERQIDLLLDAAQRHVQNGQYSQPPGNNAVSKYQQILQIDGGNRNALEGLEFIRSRFLDMGLSALAEDNEKAAVLALTKISSMDEQSQEAQSLSQALQRFRNQQKIDEWLQKAESAVADDELILPARANALFYYQQITELDPQNHQAREGIQSIADAFVSKANAAVIEGDLQAANGFLATVSVIDAEHPSVPLLEAMIENAEPLADKAAQASRPTATRSALKKSQSGTPPEPDSSTSTSLPNKPSSVSNNRTPEGVAREREEFDRRYLQRGLDAYYRGDYDEASALLQPLADKGISRAQFRIGYMHFLGRGFPRSRDNADRIIRAALPAVQKFADEGRAWAQSDIGSLYEDGLVLPRDLNQALYWYRSAAEQGYAGAQTNLGVMYAEGRGVPASRDTAVQWFLRATKQGDVTAARNLEAMGVEP